MKLTTALAPAILAMAVAFSSPAAAALTVIDFEGDATGVRSEGFASSDYAGLKLYSDRGAGLEIRDYSPQTQGKGLLVRTDIDGNFLRGVFEDGGHTFLSLDFGNDDPAFLNATDRAVLTVFFGGAQVGQTIFAPNLNDLMDQTISFDGVHFDSFTFAFANVAGAPTTGGGDLNTGLIEVVDNISFGSLGSPVPEPYAWALMILGFGAVGATLRRHQFAVA